MLTQTPRAASSGLGWGDVRPVPVKVSGKDHLLQRVVIMGMASDDSEVGLARRDLCAEHSVFVGVSHLFILRRRTGRALRGSLMKPHVNELRPTVGK